MKRIALLLGLTLALATPAHAGKKNKKKAPDVSDWIELATDMGVQFRGGQLRIADPNLALQQAYGFMNAHGFQVDGLDQVANLAFMELGLEPLAKKKKRKGKKKGKKGKNNAQSSPGTHRVAAARR